MSEHRSERELLTDLIEAWKTGLNDRSVLSAAGWRNVMAGRPERFANYVRGIVDKMTEADGIQWRPSGPRAGKAKKERESFCRVRSQRLNVHTRTGAHESDAVFAEMVIRPDRSIAVQLVLWPRPSDSLSKETRRELVDLVTGSAQQLDLSVARESDNETHFRLMWDRAKVEAAGSDDASANGLFKELTSTLAECGRLAKQALPEVEARLPEPAPTKTETPKRPGGDQMTNRSEEFKDHLEQNPCLVLQGPPGTGKTYAAEQLIKLLADTEDFKTCRYGHVVRTNGDLIAPNVVWEFVQMHPGYSYEDFVRGLVTDSQGSGIRFVSKDRILVKMARIAADRERADKTKRTVLILDEINRCNLASVLGELIYCLEESKRGPEHEMHLQYDEEDRSPGRLFLPNSLWIVGTMNTADRSIALVDYAIRRRFRFIDLAPDMDVIRHPRAEELFKLVWDLVKEPRLKIGHSYFMVDPGEGRAKRLANKFLYETVPLLREYHAEQLLKEGKFELTVSDGMTISLRDSSSVEPLVAKLEAWLDAG